MSRQENFPQNIESDFAPQNQDTTPDGSNRLRRFLELGGATLAVTAALAVVNVAPNNAEAATETEVRKQLTVGEVVAEVDGHMAYSIGELIEKDEKGSSAIRITPQDNDVVYRAVAAAGTAKFQATAPGGSLLPSRSTFTQFGANASGITRATLSTLSPYGYQLVTKKTNQPTHKLVARGDKCTYDGKKITPDLCMKQLVGYAERVDDFIDSLPYVSSTPA